MKEIVNKNCPIPITHTRLNQVLSIFEDINNSYQDPEKFTTNLNNLIQGLRNITFILQSEKHKIKDFDSWYKPFQDIMKEDNVMRWLVDSRNHVVKKGDLEKDSYLSLRIVNHENHEIFEEKFDPFITTDDAIEAFRRIFKIKCANEYIIEDLVVEAERKWVVASYPNSELIDVLIYCFSILVGIVFSAHKILGVEALFCDKNVFFDIDEDYMIVLRNKLKEKRTTRVSYLDGCSFTYRKKQITRDDIDVKKDFDKVKEKYGDVEKIKKEMKPADGEDIPFCFMNYHLEMSKRFMLVDGGILAACFFYFSKEKPPRMVFFDPHHPSSRYSMGEEIARVAEETNCRAVIFISEVWIGDFPKNKNDYIPARNQKDRKEAVSIVAITPEKTKEILLPFSRKDEKIILEEEKVSSLNEWPFFTKLQEVWSKQNK